MHVFTLKRQPSSLAGDATRLLTIVNNTRLAGCLKSDQSESYVVSQPPIGSVQWLVSPRAAYSASRPVLLLALAATKQNNTSNQSNEFCTSVSIPILRLKLLLVIYIVLQYHNDQCFHYNTELFFLYDFKKLTACLHCLRRV